MSKNCKTGIEPDVITNTEDILFSQVRDLVKVHCCIVLLCVIVLYCAQIKKIKSVLWVCISKRMGRLFGRLPFFTELSHRPS